MDPRAGGEVKTMQHLKSNPVQTEFLTKIV
jgi:hypothetical protein